MRSLRKADWDYINNIISQGLQKINVNPFWHFIKSRKQNKIGVVPLKKNGSLVCDTNGEAEILLEQFHRPAEFLLAHQVSGL